MAAAICVGCGTSTPPPAGDDRAGRGGRGRAGRRSWTGTPAARRSRKRRCRFGEPPPRCRSWTHGGHSWSAAWAQDSHRRFAGSRVPAQRIILRSGAGYPGPCPGPRLRGGGDDQIRAEIHCKGAGGAGRRARRRTAARPAQAPARGDLVARTAGSRARVQPWSLHVSRAAAGGHPARRRQALWGGVGS